MAVDRDVSQAHVETELERAAPILQRFGWSLNWNPDDLRLIATIKAKDDEPYIYEFTLDDYREMPPNIEAIYHGDRAERNTKRCFPSCDLKYVHGHDLICAPWNRRSYKTHSERGPHNDWDISQWPNIVPSGRNDPPRKDLGEMLVTLAQLVTHSSYKGRQ